MLTMRDVGLRVGGEELLQSVSLEIFTGHRVGLIGRNGSGKSTLLKSISGQIEPDQGVVALSSHVRVATVAQETPDTDASVLTFTLDGDEELRRLQDRLATPVHDDGYFAAESRYEAIEGFAAAARASQLLAGLGFKQDDLERPVNALSGGWRMRLNLARTLMARADFLLLDEPTNHLDLEAIAWLEQYLARFEGALLVVSHDRDFLNAVVNRIAYLHDRRVTLYAGSFDDFVERRALEAAQHEAAYGRQQAQIEALERFVARFRAKATKARQAQSRLKTLERLERVAKIQGEVAYTLPLRSPGRAPAALVALRAVSFAYPGAPVLFGDVNLTIAPGDRIALIGPNGAGKSTFLKVLLGQLAPVTGTQVLGPGVKVGYFAQHQLEQLDGDMVPLEYLERLDPGAGPQALRDYLGRFGFGPGALDRQIKSFSGGEKSRLVLAGVSWQAPHLLLLDEPTNHLDLEMREALSYALQDFSGALVLVSHDRHLIRSCADRLWLVADGQAGEFTGDLDDYQKVLTTRRPAASQRERPPRPARQPAVSPRPYEREQKVIEARLAVSEARLDQIDAVLGEPRIYQQGGDAVKVLQVERESLVSQHQQDEERWLALEEKLEALRTSPP